MATCQFKRFLSTLRSPHYLMVAKRLKYLGRRGNLPRCPLRQRQRRSKKGHGPICTDGLDRRPLPGKQQLRSEDQQLRALHHHLQNRIAEKCESFNDSGGGSTVSVPGYNLYVKSSG